MFLVYALRNVNNHVNVRKVESSCRPGSIVFPARPGISSQPTLCNHGFKHRVPFNGKYILFGCCISCYRFNTSTTLLVTVLYAVTVPFLALLNTYLTGEHSCGDSLGYRYCYSVAGTVTILYVVTVTILQLLLHYPSYCYNTAVTVTILQVLLQCCSYCYSVAVTVTVLQVPL